MHLSNCNFSRDFVSFTRLICLCFVLNDCINVGEVFFAYGDDSCILVDRLMVDFDLVENHFLKGNIGIFGVVEHPFVLSGLLYFTNLTGRFSRGVMVNHCWWFSVVVYAYGFGFVEQVLVSVSFYLVANCCIGLERQNNYSREEEGVAN